MVPAVSGQRKRLPDLRSPIIGSIYDDDEEDTDEELYNSEEEENE